ncbi:MAG: PAS domain-containing protein [Rhizomicrobium sp.]
MDAQALGYVLGGSPRREPLCRTREALQSVSHGLASSLIESWEGLKPRGGMVIGRHFPSRAFAKVLPNILLLERIEGMRDFRIRVAGFGMLRFYGVDLSGRNLSDFFSGDAHEMRYTLFADILSGNTPHIGLERIHRGSKLLTVREVVSLPVLASDGTTPLVLRASFWSNPRWLN